MGDEKGVCPAPLCWLDRQTANKQMSYSCSENTVQVINSQEASSPAVCPAAPCYDYLLVLFLCSEPEEREGAAVVSNG